MKYVIVLVFSLCFFDGYSQKTKMPRYQDDMYSGQQKQRSIIEVKQPEINTGFLLKKAGNNLIAGTFASLVLSGLGAAVIRNGNIKTGSTMIVVGSLTSIILTIQAGGNLIKAGKSLETTIQKPTN